MSHPKQYHNIKERLSIMCGQPFFCLEFILLGNDLINV